MFDCVIGAGVGLYCVCAWFFSFSDGEVQFSLRPPIRISQAVSTSSYLRRSDSYSFSGTVRISLREERILR